jgi:hypothetical protein
MSLFYKALLGLNTRTHARSAVVTGVSRSSLMCLAELLLRPHSVGLELDPQLVEHQDQL